MPSGDVRTHVSESGVAEQLCTKQTDQIMVRDRDDLFPRELLKQQEHLSEDAFRGRSLETPSLGNGCGRCSSVSREQGEKVNLWKDVAVMLRARPLI